MLRLLTIGETSTVLDDTIAFITSCSRSGECEDAEVTRDSDESHNVASIAATLLINGTTGHSRFRLPFRVYHDTTSSITAESAEAEVLRRAPLIVWDEAGTQKKDELEVVDRLLRDIAVSHDPPVSSLFVTNRRAGFNIAGTILAKKECYGTSLSAMMPGSIRIVLLARGDTYTVTLPYAHCEGMMIGTLSMEYGGQDPMNVQQLNELQQQAILSLRQPTDSASALQTAQIAVAAVASQQQSRESAYSQQMPVLLSTGTVHLPHSSPLRALPHPTNPHPCHSTER